MNTNRNEQQELIANNQMKMDMQVLLTSINEMTHYELSLIEDETDPPEFVISLKYKAYLNDRHGFIHRITNYEAKFLIENIFENMKELQGKDYVLKGNYEMFDPDHITYRSGRTDHDMVGGTPESLNELCKDFVVAFDTDVLKPKRKSKLEVPEHLRKK